MYIETTATRKLKNLRKRVRGVKGGTSASKTISILLLLIDKYQTVPNLTGSIVAESVPHLKRGAMRDFFNILKSHGYYDENAHNKTDSLYTFPNGSFIEFFASDDAKKLRGGRRDDLFINEGNNISYDSYNELEVRTRQTVWIDWNPVSLFWWDEKVLPYEDVDFITLTYKDNEALEDSIINSIERRKHSNPEWYKVYGLGQVGSLEGQIFKNWNTIDRIPEEAELVIRGLDFGYTNDPSCIVDIYKWNNSYIIDEVVYATGLSNANLATYLDDDVLTVADSAEPKSIDQIKELGKSITGSIKGQGSVNTGIDIVNDQEIHITKDSTNVLKDMRNYQWKKDKMGKPLNIPNHDFSHSPDAIRYAISYLESGIRLGTDDFFM